VRSHAGHRTCFHARRINVIVLSTQVVDHHVARQSRAAQQGDDLFNWNLRVGLPFEMHSHEIVEDKRLQVRARKRQRGAKRGARNGVSRVGVSAPRVPLDSIRR
jgi:hypothetical protein